MDKYGFGVEFVREGNHTKNNVWGQGTVMKVSDGVLFIIEWQMLLWIEVCPYEDPVL